MTKYIGFLNHPITLQVEFADRSVGGHYKPTISKVTLPVGGRVFRTKRKMTEWVDLMNDDHGPGTAEAVLQ